METLVNAVTTDRRVAHRRHSVEQHGVLGARVRPGHEVELIDISAGGALVECGRRLLPGTFVELHLTAADDRCACVRGRVLRCAVVQVKATGMSYRGAIVFDRDLHWFCEEPWV
jgi:hypothetical protein